MTDVFVALYFSILNIRPTEPLWEDRDRLVLSNGHICPAQYATLAHRGYFSIEELNDMIGHKTITTEVTTPITSSELNTRFPKAKEGFQVTYTTLNTTFMKIFDDSWLMSNNIQI